MHRHLPLILVIGLLIAFRAAGCLPNFPYNFQPLSALFFCGALLAPGWRGFTIPFGIWAITYPFSIGPVFEISIFLTTLLGLTATFFLGQQFSKNSVPSLVLGSVIAALVFHLITNSVAWLGDSTLYEKSFTGFWQSVWTGPAGSPMPSWVFLRNLAAANVIFTAIFAIAQLRFTKPAVLASTPVFAK